MIPDLLIEYQEYSPPPVAADHIHSIWAFRVAADADTVAHTVWPDACASIVFPSVGPYALFMGAETGPRATPVHRASVTWGIRAWVDAAAVFGHTCVGMRGIVSLAPHFDRLGMRLRASPQHGELLLREWCETQAESWHTPDPIVRATANYIIAHSHRVRLTDIAAHVSLGRHKPRTERGRVDRSTRTK